MHKSCELKKFMQKIPRARLRRWLNNDVTKAYLEIVKAEGAELSNYIAFGGALPGPNSNQTIETNYIRHVGMVEALALMADFQACFEKYDLIQEEDEGDSGDE